MKNSSTSERLKQIMNERSLRQVDILEAAKPFCEKYGIKLAKNDLSQYVSGKVEPRQEKLTILGLALNVSETWLMGYDVRRERDEKEQLTVPSELSDVKARLIQYVYPLTDEQAALALRVLKSILEDAE
jgi:transcriptional regulator with XRE-family HTH domain